MPIKQILTAAAIAALVAPSFSVAQTTITREDCEAQGGTVNEDDGVCVGAVLSGGEAAGLGGGLAVGNGAIAAGVVLVLAVAAAGGSSSGTTTTTTTTTTSP